MPMTAAYAPALNHGFEGFLDFLRDQEAGPAVLSPKRFSDVLSIDLQTLAGQAHVHRNTLSRAPASESVQRFMREALRVLRAADDLTGGPVGSVEIPARIPFGFHGNWIPTTA